MISIAGHRRNYKPKVQREREERREREKRLKKEAPKEGPLSWPAAHFLRGRGRAGRSYNLILQLNVHVKHVRKAT